MAPSWKHFGTAFGILIGLAIVSGFEPSEKRIPGSLLTVDALIYLFTVFAVMYADKLDQIISVMKQGNRNNNND